jgi:hypothetical protein
MGHEPGPFGLGKLNGDGGFPPREGVSGEKQQQSCQGKKDDSGGKGHERNSGKEIHGSPVNWHEESVLWKVINLTFLPLFVQLISLEW